MYALHGTAEDSIENDEVHDPIYFHQPRPTTISGAGAGAAPQPIYSSVHPTDHNRQPLLSPEAAYSAAPMPMPMQAALAPHQQFYSPSHAPPFAHQSSPAVAMMSPGAPHHMHMQQQQPAVPPANSYVYGAGSPPHMSHHVLAAGGAPMPAVAPQWMGGHSPSAASHPDDFLLARASTSPAAPRHSLVTGASPSHVPQQLLAVGGVSVSLYPPISAAAHPLPLASGQKLAQQLPHPQPRPKKRVTFGPVTYVAITPRGSQDREETQASLLDGAGGSQSLFDSQQQQQLHVDDVPAQAAHVPPPPSVFGQQSAQQPALFPSAGAPSGAPVSPHRSEQEAPTQEAVAAHDSAVAHPPHPPAEERFVAESAAAKFLNFLSMPSDDNIASATTVFNGSGGTDAPTAIASGFSVVPTGAADSGDDNAIVAPGGLEGKASFVSAAHMAGGGASPPPPPPTPREHEASFAQFEVYGSDSGMSPASSASAGSTAAAAGGGKAKKKGGQKRGSDTTADAAEGDQSQERRKKARGTDGRKPIVPAEHSNGRNPWTLSKRYDTSERDALVALPPTVGGTCSIPSDGLSRLSGSAADDGGAWVVDDDDWVSADVAAEKERATSRSAATAAVAEAERRTATASQIANAEVIDVGPIPVSAAPPVVSTVSSGTADPSDDATEITSTAAGETKHPHTQRATASSSAAVDTSLLSPMRAERPLMAAPAPQAISLASGSTVLSAEGSSSVLRPSAKENTQAPPPAASARAGCVASAPTNTSTSSGGTAEGQGTLHSPPPPILPTCAASSTEKCAARPPAHGPQQAGGFGFAISCDLCMTAEVPDARGMLFCPISSAPSTATASATDPPEPLNTSLFANAYAVHVSCALWAPEVFYEEAGRAWVSLPEAIGRGRQIKCAHCRQWGATIGCASRACQRSYHYHCAVELAAEGRAVMDHEGLQLRCHRHAAVWRRDAPAAQASVIPSDGAVAQRAAPSSESV